MAIENEGEQMFSLQEERESGFHKISRITWSGLGNSAKDFLAQERALWHQILA